ncbi:MAG: HMA2 domain-containing protein [Syntrophobacteraceae bacterium]
MTEICDILLLAKHVNIVHHIPGRIRLRVSPSGVSVARRTDFDRLMNGIPGVLKTRVSPIVGSIVIDYDCERLPPDLWDLLVRCNYDPSLTSEVEDRLTRLWKN